MKKNNIPFIEVAELKIVNGAEKIVKRKIYANAPTLGTWRKFMKLQSEASNLNNNSVEDFINFNIRIIITGFNNSEITETVLDDNLDIVDMMPKVRELSEWLQELTFKKIKTFEEQTNKKK